MNIRSVKGMNDVFTPEIASWRRVEDCVRRHFECYGYSEIKTPIVENTALFSRTSGDTSDIVQKQMYTFLDKGNDSLTLRPEGTAGVVRAVIEHNLLNLSPIHKFYYIAPMFRYERPQKGRYRQHYQYGVEVFGMDSPKLDVEAISMLNELFRKLNLPDLETKLNSLGCDECRPVYIKKLHEILNQQKDNLCDDSQRRFQTNPLRVLDCKDEKCKKITATLPGMVEFLCEPCKAHFSQVQEGLKKLSVPFKIDKALVRGLDYYNRTVFEVVTSHLGAQSSLAGGGRYDGLVSELGGPATPAFGFGGGMERLVMVLPEDLKKPETLPLFLVAPDEAGADFCFQLAHELRKKGLHCELDLSGKNMKNQMKRADRLGAKFSLIVGESEVKAGEALLKNMATQNQEKMKIENLVDELLRRLV